MEASSPGRIDGQLHWRNQRVMDQTMRHLAIGDVHGCLRSLVAVAKAARIRETDVVVTLGDYVDRGPDSRGVIDWLIAWARRGHLIAIRGNHDLMMMQARGDAASMSGWLDSGGDAALASYGGTIDTIPAEHWEFLEATRLWYATDSHFFVHAGVYADYALEDQPEYMLLWEKIDETRPHVSGKVMICGHTPQKSGIPRNLGHAVCIDTNACRGGWLTCLDVGTGEYWQGNESGDVRRDRLT